MSDVLHSFYIGDPDPLHERGQDKQGQVHCLCWLMIYAKGKFFAKSNEYTLGHSGGGIGRAKTVKDGKKRLHAYAITYLKRQLREAKYLVKRIEKALELLGDNPDNLDKFKGDYVK